jgi:teichuronic acid exporter
MDRKTVKEKAVSGIVWKSLETGSQNIVNLVISMVLARLLLPEQFGLLGMLAIFMGIAQSVIDSGFSTALIQKGDADQRDFSTVFYFNIVISILMFYTMYLASPFIADFYNEAKLIKLARFMEWLSRRNKCTIWISKKNDVSAVSSL